MFSFPKTVGRMFQQTNLGKLRPFTYKSAIALETLYPSSSFKWTNVEKPQSNAADKFSGFIPMDKVEITYSRSTGPGGQNVNKVNTKVDIRFHLQTAEWLDEDIRSKMAEKYKGRLSKEGFIIFRSDLTRSQQLNVADALHKLRTAIRSVCIDKPQISKETEEKLQDRLERASKERLAVKRQRSDVKSSRRAPNVYDF